MSTTVAHGMRGVAYSRFQSNCACASRSALPTLNNMTNNNNGFSLIEVMINLAILSVVALGVMTLVKVISEQQANLDAKLDHRILAGELVSMLESPAMCPSLFEPGYALDREALVSEEGLQLPGVVLTSGEILRPGATVAAYSLQIEDLRLTNAQSSGANTYRVRFEGRFRARKGTQTPYRPFFVPNVMVTVDEDDHIVSCSTQGGGPETPIVENPFADAKALCAALAGSWLEPNKGQGARCYFCNNVHSPFYGFTAQPDGEGKYKVQQNCPPPEQQGA